MPVLARDASGLVREFLIRDVRIVPNFAATLLSVEQLWENSRVDTVFRDERCLHAPNGPGEPPIR